MWLGHITLKRPPDAPDDKRYVNLGSLWYGDKGDAHIRLKAWAQGRWMCRPYASIADPPFISGDIMVATGEYVKDLVKEYIWCGYMSSHQDEKGGTMYWGTFEVIPLIFPVHHPVDKKDKRTIMCGIWLKVVNE